MDRLKFPSLLAREPGAADHTKGDLPPVGNQNLVDIRRWTVMQRGGHFAAMEQPTALADEIRAFYGPLREAEVTQGAVVE